MHCYFVSKEQFSVYKPGISPLTNPTYARNTQAMRVLKNKCRNHSFKSDSEFGSYK